MIIGNINDFISDEVIEKSKKQAKIFFEKNPRGRSIDRIFQDTLYGEIAELAVACYFKGYQVPFEISYYDVDSPYGKIEVKHTRINSNYWEFFAGYYDHFLYNAHRIDKIVLVKIEENGDLNLKYVANAKTFHHYIRQSKFDENVFYIAESTAIRDRNLEKL